MKEFEKWFDNEFNCEDVPCYGVKCQDCKQNQKNTWKAALEWVRDNIKKGENGKFQLTREGVLLLIEEELNGTN